MSARFSKLRTVRQSLETKTGGPSPVDAPPVVIIISTDSAGPANQEPPARLSGIEITRWTLTGSIP